MTEDRERLALDDERQLRRSARFARCAFTFIAVDGRPIECGLIPSRHEPGWPDSDHLFTPKFTVAGLAYRLLAAVERR